MTSYLIHQIDSSFLLQFTEKLFEEHVFTETSAGRTHRSRQNRNKNDEYDSLGIHSLSGEQKKKTKLLLESNRFELASKVMSRVPFILLSPLLG